MYRIGKWKIKVFPDRIEVPSDCSYNDVDEMLAMLGGKRGVFPFRGIGKWPQPNNPSERTLQVGMLDKATGTKLRQMVIFKNHIAIASGNHFMVYYLNGERLLGQGSVNDFLSEIRVPLGKYPFHNTHGVVWPTWSTLTEKQAQLDFLVKVAGPPKLKKDTPFVSGNITISKDTINKILKCTE